MISREMPVPDRHFKTGDSLCHGWHIRQKWRTLGFGDGQQSQRPGFHMLKALGTGGE